MPFCFRYSLMLRLDKRILSETSLNCSFQPFVRCLCDAILQATLNGVLPSFSESQKRCLPISSFGTPSSASSNKVSSSATQAWRAFGKRGSGTGACFSSFGFDAAGTVGFFMLTRAFMAPMAATASTSVSRSWRVSRLSSQIRVFRLSISVFSQGSVAFIFMLILLVWWRSVPALIHLDGDRQACIKTGLIPAGHLQGITLFYPPYTSGICQL